MLSTNSWVKTDIKPGMNDHEPNKARPVKQETTMKKLIFALALLVMGGASLSTASAASISPAAATISEAARSDGMLQLTGGNHHRRKYFRYGGHRRDFFYAKGFSWYPYGYYDGYCYDHPYHWWCKRYFYKRY
jgi:hypothetical protein